MHHSSRGPQTHRPFRLMLPTVTILLALVAGLGISMGHNTAPSHGASPNGPSAAHSDLSDEGVARIDTTAQFTSTSTPTQTVTPEPLILPPVDPAAVEGDIIAAGSSTVFRLAERIADEFTDEGYNGRITIDSIGSGAGFERFCVATETDISAAVRPMRDDEREACRENGREPVTFRVGTEALVVVVNNANDLIPSVTMEQLALLFSTAEIWADVNLELPHQPVLVFTPGTASSEFDFFVEAVFDGDASLLLNASSLVINDDANLVVENVEIYPYAIGFIDYATYQQAQGRVRALAINGVEPTSANIEAGNYALARPLLMYTTAQIMQEKPQVAAFLNYGLSSVTDLAADVGYLPPSTDLLNQSKEMWLAATALPPPSEPLILPPVDPAAVEGDIIAAGSSTVFPLAERIANEFTDEGYNGRITIDSIGSGAGFERFCVATETDISNAVRPIRMEEVEVCRENGREPVAFHLGTDSLAVVVNTENDFLDEVTLEELALLFSTAEMWADVNPEWPAEPIQRFVPGTDSGTYDFFVETVFDEDDVRLLSASNLQMSEDDNVLLQGVESTPYAIGFFSYAYYQQEKDRMKLLSIDGVEPTSANIEAGDYALARPLLMYTTAQIMQEKPQVAAFLNYSLSSVTDLAADVGSLPPSTDLLNQSKETWLAITVPYPPDLMLDDPIGGLDLPVHITNAGDGTGRLFVAEQRGRIRIIQDGAVQETPFLDISERVSCCDQRGLFSVAFSPTYTTTGTLTGTFFISYTRAEDNAIVVARYEVSDDADMADPASEQILLTIAQPAINQNGGSLTFGPDGYLYIGTGDGGVSDDDPDNAQDPTSLLGKLLRIDVDDTDTLTYTIPATNPYSATADYRPELWALGLRNPWQFSFDSATGDLFVADVGKSSYEEVNYQPAESSGGENYGWRCKEATHDYDPSGDCEGQQFTFPIYEYAHEESNCAIIGGLVYRGAAYEQLQGTYLYGDYCSGLVWGLQQRGNEWSSTLLAETGFERSLTSFGASEAGEVYIADHLGGSIHRLLIDNEPALTSNYTTGAPGSSFTLRGKHFPSITRLTLVLNRPMQIAQEEVLGTVMTDVRGEFDATLTTSGADPGTYTIAVQGFADTGVTLTLATDEELRVPDDAGSSAQLFLTPQRVFLPLIQR